MIDFAKVGRAAAADALGRLGDWRAFLLLERMSRRAPQLVAKCARLAANRLSHMRPATDD